MNLSPISPCRHDALDVATAYQSPTSPDTVASTTATPFEPPERDTQSLTSSPGATVISGWSGSSNTSAGHPQPVNDSIPADSPAADGTTLTVAA